MKKLLAAWMNTITQSGSFWLVLGWSLMLVLIVFLSLLPETGNEISRVPPAITNYGHAPAYSLLTIFTLLLVSRWKRLTVVTMIGVALFVSGTGVALEVLQPFFGRSADIADLASNAAGILFAISFWCFRVNSRNNTKSKCQK